MSRSESDKEAARLRELFKGRFDQGTALRLIEDLGSLLGAVDFLLNEDPEQVRSFMKQSPDYLQSLRIDSANVASILENGIEDSVRQFVCGSCKRSWWKRVPTRKEVSKCSRCRIKYDPIPREHESGLGKFICPCGNEFTGFAAMGETLSECYQCGAKVPVDCMIPPRRNRERKSNAPHSCNGDNCYNRNHKHNQVANFHVQEDLYLTPVAMGGYTPKRRSNSDFNRSRVEQPAEPPVCVHPKSSKKEIRHVSKKHHSTGSTVSTFLDQGSIDTQSVSVVSTLYSIHE